MKTAMYSVRRVVLTRQRRLKHTQNYSPNPTPKDPTNLSSLLATPSWSVRSLVSTPPPNPPTALNITRKQLHHLLRLSALPLPSSEAEEAKLIADLESQLQFVRAIQEVDTDGVEPLKAIRDETRDAKRESEIGLESLRAEFEKEEVVGKRGRIMKREGFEAETGDGERKDGVEGWDLLRQAPKKMGRFVVVETGKD